MVQNFTDAPTKEGDSSSSVPVTQHGSFSLVILPIIHPIQAPSYVAEILPTVIAAHCRKSMASVIPRLFCLETARFKLEPLLWAVLEGRNRLGHSFYRQHNFRKFSEAGRVIMMRDLDTIHDMLLKAYKALMLLSGIDLDALAKESAKARENMDSADGPDDGPLFHVPI